MAIKRWTCIDKDKVMMKHSNLAQERLGILRRKLGIARGMLVSARIALECDQDNDDCSREDIDRALSESADDGDEWAEPTQKKSLGQCRHDIDALHKISENSVCYGDIRVVNSADLNAIDRLRERDRDRIIKECIERLSSGQGVHEGGTLMTPRDRLESMLSENKKT
jgi:hypothetical protein